MADEPRPLIPGLPTSTEEERVLRTVLAAIRQIRHGHVHIIVQDGKVIQIERLEKERLRQ